MFKKAMKRLFFVLAISLIIMVGGCESSDFLTLLLMHNESYLAAGETAVHFLDTGQSNATLIQTDSGENILIDTGSAESRDELFEALEEHGVDEIDLLVITHWHLDHAGGAAQVIERYPVSEAWVTDNLNSNKTTEKTLEALDTYAVKIKVVSPGDKQTYGDTIFTVVGPVEDYEDQNLSSIVIRMTHGKNHFLFPGDMERAATNSLIASGQDLRSNVLLAPHHGSAYAVNEEFWKALGRDLSYVVAECGSGNQYGHPHREIVEYCKENGIEFFQTDKDGEVLLISSPDGIFQAIED